MEPHFFQLLDRIRFQAAVGALAREGKNLALISQIQALSEHYKEALLNRLQHDVPGLEIKTFFPADPDGIVHHFNQVVAEIPISQALDQTQNQGNIKLWVVHDAAALPSHELRLLLQLLEKFPGSQVRALLVYGGVETLPNDLEVFDKSLMRWIVERPSLDHIKEALAQEKDETRITSLRALIQRMAPGGSNKEAVAAALNSHAASMRKIQRDDPPAPSRLSRWLKFFLAAMMLLAVSIGVALMLHPQVLQKILPDWLQRSESSADVANSTAAQAAMKSIPTTETKSIAIDSKDLASAPSLKEASKTVESELALTTEVQITELPEEAVKGEQWAWQLSVSQTIIQHGITPTYAKAIELRQRYSVLSEARVVPQFIGNESQARFAIISGPFQTKEEAERWIKIQKVPKDSWVRNAAALQERLLIHSTQIKNP